MSSLVVGTAGHIDHGKTALVGALTGKDTDRLPEERERGISIDLGYAPLDLPDGRRLSLIDVPGHERFVRTMVAGATGVDLFLLVIDAAEGARPQTHEHLAILRLLGIERGVVAVTKADTVDEDTLELALEEARELVPAAPVLAVSARTRQGLDELRAALADVAAQGVRAGKVLPTRLFVDRVFTLRGIGTVATGTLWSGSVGAGDVLRVEPGGRDVRVRSVEVHDETVERARAGQRVAVSLPGVDRDRLRRGDALVQPDAYPSSYRLDVALDELEPIPDGARLKAHHGTSDIPARLVRAGDRYAQLRLAEPVTAFRGDRVILRGETTLAGARVLDPAPPRRVDSDRLARLDGAEPSMLVRLSVHEPTTLQALASRGLLSEQELTSALGEVGQAGEWIYGLEWLEELKARVHERLRRRAQSSSVDPGLPLADVLPPRPWSAAILPLLEIEQRGPKLYLPGTTADLGDREQSAVGLERELARAGADPVKVDDAELAAFLEGQGRLVRVGDGLAVHPQAYDQARRLVIDECEASGRITLARLRDLLGSSRRSTQLLLERLDADGVTRRVGDQRVLRRSAARR